MTRRLDLRRLTGTMLVRLLALYLSCVGCGAACDGSVRRPTGGEPAPRTTTDEPPPAPQPELEHVIYVAPNGDDLADGSAGAPLKSIHVALDRASSGTVVELAPGSYAVKHPEASHGVVLDKDGVSLRGRGEVVLEPANERATYGVDLTGDHVRLEGVTLRGFPNGTITFGRTDRTQKEALIRNVRVEGGTDGIRSVVVPGGPGDEPVIDGLVLEDVTIVGPTLVGFNCGEGPCNRLRLTRVEVQMQRGGGGWGADGIAIESGDDVLVEHARVTGARSDGIDIKATKARVVHSIVRDVGRNGIKLWHGGDVINCLVTGTGGDAAIVFDRGGTYRVLHSVVARHAVGGRAYSLVLGYDHEHEPAKLTVVNSIFYDNAGPVWVSGATEVDVRTSAFWGSANGVEFVRGSPGGRTDVSYGAGGNKVGTLGSGVLNVDPRFVDPAGGDFHLGPDSPVRDVGAAPVDGAPAKDLEGRPRVLGGVPDLGVYEG